MGLSLSPITQREAFEFVRVHHRHHQAPRGSLFQIAANDGVEVRGVVIVGRPVARMLQDGYTAEVLRLCTDGAHNSCLLYALCSVLACSSCNGLPEARYIHTKRRRGWFSQGVGMEVHWLGWRRLVEPFRTT
jgi:hypothetical protein